MDWIDPEVQLPPQGKKVIYYSQCDMYVCQRWGKYWLPHPFHDSQYSFTKPPELWSDIYPPGNKTGKVHVIVNHQQHDIDSLEIHHPDVYREIMELTLGLWKINVER